MDRIFALGGGSRAGSGAGTSFIGKQAALDPVHKNSSETAGYRLTHAEASEKIRLNTDGSFGRLTRMMNNVSRKNQPP